MRGLIFILILTGLTACDSATSKKKVSTEKSSDSTDESINQADTLKDLQPKDHRIFQGEVYLKIQHPVNKGDNGEVRIKYMYFDAADQLTSAEKKVNELIVERTGIMKKERFLRQQNRKLKEEYFEEYLNDFRDECLTAIDEMPDMAVWYLDEEVQIDDRYKDFYVLCTQMENYLGGAHGSHFISNDLIDRKTGKHLLLKDVVKDVQTLNRIAEAAFRKEFKMTPGQTFDDAGFWFEDGFFCPENFYFTDKEMVFIYNEYEAGPYAIGIPSFSIPLTKLKDHLIISTDKF